MRIYKLFNLLLLIIFLLSTSEVFASYEKLTKANYEKSKNDKAVVIYGVNWGRQWGCTGLNNAQLQNITFSRIDPTSNQLAENVALDVPAKLLSEDISVPSAIIVNPGVYALSGFDIKTAGPSRQVGHLKVSTEDLFENGKPVGGTFKVSAGEVIYIGDFGLDCTKKPMPWRYYIEKGDFDRYVVGFKKKYNFLSDKVVVYRLFETNKFGQLHDASYGIMKEDAVKIAKDYVVKNGIKVHSLMPNGVRFAKNKYTSNKNSAYYTDDPKYQDKTIAVWEVGFSCKAPGMLPVPLPCFVHVNVDDGKVIYEYMDTM